MTVLEPFHDVGARYAGGNSSASLVHPIFFYIFNQCQPSMIDVNGWPVVSLKTWFTQFVQLQQRERERGM